MTLADYIKDDNRAYAAEILNANAATIEEMIVAIHEANNMMRKFADVRDDWFNICYDYDNAVINLNETKAKLERLMKFKNSKVASLIAKYIENHTPELLKEIKAEIEATNNPFEITIYEGCVDFDWSDCYFDKFYIDTIHTFYTSKHRYYLDEDIERCKRQIKWETENKERYEKLRAEMLAEYGDCLLEINLHED